MVLIQLTGLSGSGKSTIAFAVRALLQKEGHAVEVIDGDTYRKHLCPDLGFSKQDRNENIRRLGFVAERMTANGVIAIIAAINPYEEIRQEISNYGNHVKTVWINCDLKTLIDRDTKQLYKRALLPDGHPEKINNLTGVSDPFEMPDNADLIIDTHKRSEEECVKQLYNYIMHQLPG
ncbi:adenylyl-sulfate kinase [Flavihumibacter stibioxidans]|uniref:Adenylyl-sulfate kinase n=1 Tax=Flavihumibacter stibioxidans TaxID=1834163 RepID=A0ABR7MAF8_9BACT|nr:adenylyl-sulfate kinase [Flavihumibacter stibioxidans]MBC6492033.1 adenylyl-sulfate kinase [Flavihumibacter stibioxidans]